MVIGFRLEDEAASNLPIVRVKSAAVGSSTLSRRDLNYTKTAPEVRRRSQVRLRAESLYAFQGARYGRLRSLLASGSPMIFSLFTFQLIFLPVSIEISPRCPGMAE